VDIFNIALHLSLEDSRKSYGNKINGFMETTILLLQEL